MPTLHSPAVFETIPFWVAIVGTLLIVAGGIVTKFFWDVICEMRKNRDDDKNNIKELFEIVNEIRVSVGILRDRDHRGRKNDISS